MSKKAYYNEIIMFLEKTHYNVDVGTRMWRRGANFEGDSANFIETEQLLETEEFKFSFLQVLLYMLL